MIKIIEMLLKKYRIGAAKNDTFIEQVCYENSTDKSNESIHLELSTPTYAKGQHTLCCPCVETQLRRCDTHAVCGPGVSCLQSWVKLGVLRASLTTTLHLAGLRIKYVCLVFGLNSPNLT